MLFILDHKVFFTQTPRFYNMFLVHLPGHGYGRERSRGWEAKRPGRLPDPLGQRCRLALGPGLALQQLTRECLSRGVSPGTLCWVYS